MRAKLFFPLSLFPRIIIKNKVLIRFSLLSFFNLLFSNRPTGMLIRSFPKSFQTSSFEITRSVNDGTFFFLGSSLFDIRTYNEYPCTCKQVRCIGITFERMEKLWKTVGNISTGWNGLLRLTFNVYPQK